MVSLADQTSLTLVLGLGNPIQQDDGLGMHAVELLAERELPSDVVVEGAGMPGWGLANWLGGFAKVVLVDAARMGQAPGTWRRFSPQEVRLLARGEMLSLHEADLASGLALAEALKILPDEIVFYGVEPECTEPGLSLTSVVQSALPDLIENIYQEIWKGKE